MASLAALKAELVNDPLLYGYSSMSDAQAAAKLNEIGRTLERSTLRGSDIFNAVDPAEFTALSAASQARARDVWGLGDSIDIRTNTNARNILLSIFGAGTQTRSSLAALVSRQGSRAEELFGEAVTPSDVADARRLP